MKMLSAVPSDLAQYKGIPAYHTIEKKYLSAIKNTKWAQYASDFLTIDRPISKYAYPLLSNWDFASAPGSGAHHTHYGGLAVHTLQNLEYAETWADLYAARGVHVDKDLIFSSIIIHDTLKRFIYHFDDQFNLHKAEDAFIAKNEDHHSWVIREMTARGCDAELLLSVAAMHGIDDTSLEQGVRSVAIVNHYLHIGGSMLRYTVDDVRQEHVIAFLSDSDWHWSGQAQRKTGILAEQMAVRYNTSPGHMRVYLGSCFTFELVGDYIQQHGYQQAIEYFSQLIG